MDPYERLALTLDYLFGRGVSKVMPKELTFEYSRKTGKVKAFFRNGRLAGTFRPDGGIALTVYGASLLVRSKAFLENCVTVKGVEEFIAKGRSVFSKHIVSRGTRIRPGSEVAVLDEKGSVIAVGKAVLSSKMMERFKTGVAVKVREGAWKYMEGRQEGS